MNQLNMKFKMRTITDKEIEAMPFEDFETLLDSVEKEPIIITTDKGNMVLLGIDEYNRFIEMTKTK